MFPLVSSGSALAALLGGMLILGALLLRRRFREMPSLEPRIAAPAPLPAAQMEQRLHDFATEIEERIHSRRALLDELIVEADREGAYRARGVTRHESDHEAGVDPSREQGPEGHVGDHAQARCFA